MFLGVKMHFTQSKYDYFLYKGSVKASYESFEKRRDKFHFQKLAKKRDLEGFLVSNFIDHDVSWIGDLTTEESETIYTSWQKRNQSLTYVLSGEIKSLADDFKSYFMVRGGQHPPILSLYKQRKISIETLVVLNDILEFFPYWDKKISDPVIWPSLRDKCLKYKPFVKYDRQKVKNILKDLVNEDK